MSERSLSRLYRRLTARPSPEDGAVLDAAAMVAIAEADLPASGRDAVVHALSRSSTHSALLRMLRELRTDSVVLAQGLAGGRDTRHPVREREGRRAAAGARRRAEGEWNPGQGVVALAACLVAVVGVWSMHLSGSRDVATDAAAAGQVARVDRIFTSSDEIFSAAMGNALASQGPRRQDEPDHVFRSGFTGS